LFSEAQKYESERHLKWQKAMMRFGNQIAAPQVLYPRFPLILRNLSRKATERP
jgi:hypothetical protein